MDKETVPFSAQWLVKYRIPPYANSKVFTGEDDAMAFAEGVEIVPGAQAIVIPIMVSDHKVPWRE